MSSEYRDFGWDDRVIQSAGYIYPVLRNMLRYDKRKRILDLGCGNGVIANFLISEGFDVIGIDASHTGVEIANRKNPGRFFLHNVSESELPAEVRDQPFDIVISTEVIEHLYAPRAFMQLVKQAVQAKGGDVIISTPYHGYLKNLGLALLNKMDGHYTALWDGGHIKFWSRQTLTTLLEEFGFQVTDFRGAGRLPYMWKSMLMRASLKRR